MSTSPRDPADRSGHDQPEGGSGAAAGHLDPWDPDLLERLGVVVPADARALETDRRELLGLPRRRLRSPALVGRPFAGLLLACGLVLAVVLSGTLGHLLAPQPAVPDPGTYALASHPATTPGLVGGLLPDAGVRVDDAVGTASRDLRPGVLFVPPAGTCTDCGRSLENLWKQAHEYGLAVYVVAPLGGADAARALMRDADQARPHLVSDSAGALVAAYRSNVAQVVLVHADGVVGGILRSPTADARLEQLLSPLRFPGAPPSLRSAVEPA